LPAKPFTDVGRFSVVLDGAAVANVLGMTVNCAFDGERVTGSEADASGTSFLSLPERSSATAARTARGVGERTFSSLLTLRAHRTLPSFSAVQWDDDGVVPKTYTLVDRGHVVGYHTTRETAVRLAGERGRENSAVESHGCAVALTPARVPICGGAHLMMAPARETATLADLTRSVTNGMLLRGMYTQVTPGLTTGFAMGNLVLDIRRGVPVARLTSSAMPFRTVSLFNQQLAALGDATTVETTSMHVQKGIPWQSFEQPVSTPAAQFSAVDLISLSNR
jgi:predicted Zn-dependent protease